MMDCLDKIDVPFPDNARRGERDGEHPEEPGDREDDRGGVRHPPRR